MVINFQSTDDLKFWEEHGEAQVFIFKNMDQVRKYVGESGQEGEIFIDGDKKYQFINNQLEEL